MFTSIWIITQAFWWRPVTPIVHLENLPGNPELSGIDVFICIADPKKEPTVDVMNTVLSAVALDYPLEKLAMYLSDDGGLPLTLYGNMESRLYLLKDTFHRLVTMIVFFRNHEFMAEEEDIKSKYEAFKKNVEKFSRGSGTEDFMVHDRPPHVELRISGIMSNGPYVLVLDCDMFCNDPTLARQSMCFHLDPEISRSLAFVQFPQIFYNVSKNDIYDGQARSAYKLNQFTSTIPSEIGKLQTLHRLNLDNNPLSVRLPKQVVSVSSLSILLDLSQNQLSGVLPMEVANLINLGYLDVLYNLLSSEIPKYVIY
ncbi:cellulose synthase-like protein E1 [Camellia sinensis]|uniref:cellulose synthase-like protein E1 n=1 Tax=Camellia sinensis TaxID=4442 RepID=UPI001036C206|nr:cellulose synthase-like protein E1 [Camellia sinensis]